MLSWSSPTRCPGKSFGSRDGNYEGSVSVNIAPCSILGKTGFILRTDANEEGRGHHPKTIIEIATEVKLRDHFNLSDGDMVKIETLSN